MMPKVREGVLVTQKIASLGNKRSVNLDGGAQFRCELLRLL